MAEPGDIVGSANPNSPRLVMDQGYVHLRDWEEPGGYCHRKHGWHIVDGDGRDMPLFTGELTDEEWGLVARIKLAGPDFLERYSLGDVANNGPLP